MAHTAISAEESACVDGVDEVERLREENKNLRISNKKLQDRVDCLYQSLNRSKRFQNDYVPYHEDDR